MASLHLTGETYTQGQMDRSLDLAHLLVAELRDASIEIGPWNRGDHVEVGHATSIEAVVVIEKDLGVETPHSCSYWRHRDAVPEAVSGIPRNEQHHMRSLEAPTCW